ncbi:HAMP domain-containing sensor histidine kinase [Nocardioides sp. Arc9.136]|uniref:sensor histidine kinase n=1 Tax=Nocardioides sp. Arc9.136 TaxID=2996826 RepID=UPI002667168B|nr:HAMP domain-containing sensor histidine kinase [Nocardioides sp. Arc9.136]WKN46550.1 HAMP domain-containing sensor histidine kinase [Nocardioides sp. Arc9.136]
MLDGPVRRRRRGLSVRLRLTLSYAGFLVAAGALVTGVLFSVLRFVPDDENLIVADDGRFVPDRSDLLGEAVPVALAGLAMLAVVGLLGGWILAGRMLRPLKELTDAAAAVSTGSLDHRVALAGPDDEFRRLADQFDRMLDQLQHSFEEQRRFTHHASHELRTPLAVTKTMLEVALMDPDGSGREHLLARLVEMNDRSIHILESLFRLARLERTDLETEPVDLAEVAAEAGRQTGTDPAAADAGVRVVWDLAAAPTHGNRAMLVQLAVNLLQNAVTHNDVPAPTVWVRTCVDRSGVSTLVVENTGVVLDEAAVATFTEPFVTGRAPSPNARWAAGSGLGLAIVASIARVHGARLDLQPRDGGGLRSVVEFGG